MKKFYLGAAVMGLLLGTSAVNAQKISQLQSHVPSLERPSSFTANATGDCDTLPLPQDWANKLAVYNAGTGGTYGFVAGKNAYGSLTSAGYFDLSGSSYGYITGASFYFFKANSNKSANLSKKVIFKIFADNGGQPGSVIGLPVEKTLSDLKKDVDAKVLTSITFPNPIPLPASKKFYVAFDYSTLSWATSALGAKDSLTIVTSSDGTSEYANLWTYWDNSPEPNNWGEVSDDYGIEIGTVIYPYVSTSETGCSVMPVRLISFNADRKNNDVTISWKIADEMNMSHYEVERADNNGQYKTIATVKALNSVKEQNYTIVDNNAFLNAATVQYRLKQVDGDGTIDYSRTISVKSAGLITDVVFQNPITNNLKIQLNLASAQNVSVSLYNMQGSMVASVKNKTCNASNNTIDMDASHLKSGMYILKINAGTEQAVYKVVKQ